MLSVGRSSSTAYRFSSHLRSSASRWRWTSHTAHRAMSDARVDASASRDQLLLVCNWPTVGTWRSLMQEKGLPVVAPDEVTHWDKITFAAIWAPQPGILAKCPNLKAVMSLGAGVDHMMKDGVVPSGLELLRIADPQMGARLATWVVWGVINHQRKMDAYLAAQRARRWDLGVEDKGSSELDNTNIAVGVLGFGVMGRSTGEMLAGMGYKVQAWARSEKQHPSITCYHGQDQLKSFVSSCHVLVCLLPLTNDTRGIINAELLSWLPRGAGVINGARGGHLVEEDLLQALNSGQVGSALLDVFHTEPLPEESPLWSHPAVRITPHVAANTVIQNGVDQIAANYFRVVEGKAALQENVVSAQQGY